jgi:aspartate aminotransferase
MLSDYYSARKPSAIRSAQIAFANRKDKVTGINAAIGNVTLPMHPAMQKRAFSLASAASPFKNGAVSYTSTVGQDETRNAFKNIIASSGFSTKDLLVQITDGGSQAMELVILGTTGKIKGKNRPLLLIDPAYANYPSMAARVKHSVVVVNRTLKKDGTFAFPSLVTIEKTIKKYRPSAIVVIPYDNPTGNFYSQSILDSIGKLAVKYNMWLISDEAYRELVYDGSQPSSVWGIEQSKVPGIMGRRISIESASKVWNACGIRIGAIVTDNSQFHQQSVAEATANLCPSAIGQYIFGSLAHISHQKLNQWYARQRQYYSKVMSQTVSQIKRLIPKAIITTPSASIYSVIELKHTTKPGFDTLEFMSWCASQGKVKIGSTSYTLLVAPMRGFYYGGGGSTQIRLSYVETPEKLAKIPQLLASLLEEYQTV